MCSQLIDNYKLLYVALSGFTTDVIAQKLVLKNSTVCQR